MSIDHTDRASHDAARNDGATQRNDRSGYWYEPEATVSGVDLLNMLRQYHDAEAEMRRQTRESMAMNETDMLALRHLLKAQRTGGVITPSMLAGMLQISTASVTALIDRLEKSGHARRDPHPTDRRSTVITPTPGTDSEVRRTLGRMHTNMLAVVEGLDDREIAAVGRFLSGMVHAVEDASIAEEHAAGTA
ncbi:MarR family winged helix-turn-helix transcriptional regulator [Plantibacter sp. YIM 135347]|uniref:MarR family winged helix-turn-helix transcriptional regulator n=1 Tax=Plantibacter sp. YIM 135347 TaxID=3423919 RepID=UPI003D327A6A